MIKGAADIAEQLLAARRALGVSQRELSRRSGLTQAQISRIENGMVDMRISSLLTLANELGMELSFEERARPPGRKPVSPGARPPTLGKKPTRRLTDPESRSGIFLDIAEELL